MCRCAWRLEPGSVTDWAGITGDLKRTVHWWCGNFVCHMFSFVCHMFGPAVQQMMD